MIILSLLKKLSKETKCMIVTTIVLVIIFGGISLSRIIQLRSTPRVIDSDTVVSKFEEISELATAKVTYQGITEVREEYFFGDEVALMIYTADVIASVDLSKAEVDVNEPDKKINIKIPQASEPEINIDKKSIEWKDVSFNELDGTEHVQEGLKQAKEECKQKIEETGLVETATENAVTSIKNLFLGLTKGEKPYTVNVEVIEADYKKENNEKGAEEKTKEGKADNANEKQG